MTYLAKFSILIISVTLSMSSAAAPVPAEQDYFSAETGYRISRYRAPTPDTVDGGTRIDIDELDRLVRDKRAVLLDVMVAVGAGPDPKTGEWRLTKQRKSLPGSVWLADVGRGALTPELHRYYARNLAQLTNKDKTHPIIIFCMADCWMSWNAVKRANDLGYTRVYWYPDGTDGWRDWDRAFVPSVPRPLSRIQVADSGRTMPDAQTIPLATGEKTVTLISHDGKRIDVAKVAFKVKTSGRASFQTTLIESPFQDEFLSMRPFRCIPGTKEMWCHLPYPYANKQEITTDDLQDLEYSLLFLFKPRGTYSINAWNGLYFKLTLNGDGNFSGTVHETDMNVLAIPPEPGVVRPITHGALSEVEPDAHRFNRIEIR